MVEATLDSQHLDLGGPSGPSGPPGELITSIGSQMTTPLPLVLHISCGEREVIANKREAFSDVRRALKNMSIEVDAKVVFGK